MINKDTTVHQMIEKCTRETDASRSTIPKGLIKKPPPELKYTMSSMSSGGSSSDSFFLGRTTPDSDAPDLAKLSPSQPSTSPTIPSLVIN
eukprot:Pgem_evm1s9680